MATKEQVIEVLKKVYDPEINIDVWTMEIIYGIEISGDSVLVKMTLTTPFCPYGGALASEIEAKILEIDGVKNAKVEIVFDPPWKPSDNLLDMLAMGIR